MAEKLESQGLTRHSGDEVIDLENSKTEPGSPASYLARLSAERQKRIQVGIMSTHARFLDTPGFEWESYFREAFDVYARELLKSSFDPQVLLDEVIPELVSDEGIRHRWHRSFHGMVERDASHTIKYGNYWVNPHQMQLLKRAVEGRQLARKARQLRHLPVISVPGDSPTSAEDVAASRSELLTEYKRRTGVHTNAAIYNARNSSIHKPEFYHWLNGKLPRTTVTAMNLERFLRSDELPKPRK